MNKKSKEAHRKERNRKAKAHIKSQVVLREVPLKGMFRVRLSRVEYDDNESPFIDFRLFQRSYDDDGEEIYHPTQKGIQMAEADFVKLVEGHFFESLDALICRDPR